MQHADRCQYGPLAAHSPGKPQESFAVTDRVGPGQHVVVADLLPHNGQSPVEPVDQRMRPEEGAGDFLDQRHHAIVPHDVRPFVHQDVAQLPSAHIAQGIRRQRNDRGKQSQHARGPDAIGSPDFRKTNEIQAAANIVQHRAEEFLGQHRERPPNRPHPHVTSQRASQQEQNAHQPDCTDGSANCRAAFSAESPRPCVARTGVTFCQRQAGRTRDVGRAEARTAHAASARVGAASATACIEEGPWQNRLFASVSICLQPRLLRAAKAAREPRQGPLPGRGARRWRRR